MNLKRAGKHLCMLLMVSLLLSIFPYTAAEAATGACGEDARWEVKGDRLTIYGGGRIDAFLEDGAKSYTPWYNPSRSTQYCNFKICVIKSGISRICSKTFYKCTNLSKLYIPKSVYKLDTDIFGGGGASHVDIYFQGTKADWDKIVGAKERALLGRKPGTYLVHYKAYDGKEPSAESLVTAGWQTDAKGTKYCNEDGTFAKSQWKQIEGKWYYFNASGYMQTGWISSGGKWYYCDSKGVMKTGWQKIGGKWYYMNSSGIMLTGWQKIGGKWYYMNSSGVMLTGWQQIGGKWYYFTSSGEMKTGYLKSGNSGYVLQSDGSMKTNGWVKSGKYWYYADASGKVLTGWQQIGGKWYYFTSSGAMKTGYLKSGNSGYILQSDGSMKANGWVKSGRFWYYADASGKVLTGWQKIGGKWYFFFEKTNGHEKVMPYWEDDITAYNPGAMFNGLTYIDGNWYYFDDNSGAMLTNTKVDVMGRSCVVDANGIVHR